VKEYVALAKAGEALFRRKLINDYQQAVLAVERRKEAMTPAQLEVLGALEAGDGRLETRLKAEQLIRDLVVETLKLAALVAADRPHSHVEPDYAAGYSDGRDDAAGAVRYAADNPELLERYVEKLT
jgi:hypothetical protein